MIKQSKLFPRYLFEKQGEGREDRDAGYVKNITNVVSNVNGAFQELADNSEEVLEFMDNRVRKDYNLLVSTGEKYEQIAETAQNQAAVAEKSSGLIATFKI